MTRLRWPGQAERLRTPGRQTLGCLALAAALLAGCATQRDMDMAVADLTSLRQTQDEHYRALTARLDQRAGELAATQSHLSASQSEFRAESESIASQVARLGTSLAALEKDIASQDNRLKGLQNTQAVGMGALSERIDTNQTKLAGRLDAQTTTLDKFATEVGTRVDADRKDLDALTVRVATLSDSLTKQQKTLVTLAKKLDALDKKLAAAPAAGAGEAGGGSSADVAALRKQVDFLGKQLPTQVDAQNKAIKDIQTLLSDLNKRIKALEGQGR
ncbi:MAG: hypothetical protein OEW11_08615 [Nitrospirota bacterium]|nr:hypothetical protein [Nitrospirota bacterium]